MMATWPFIPQVGIVEALEWNTDIIRCKSAEQRLCMRPIPRQEFTLRHVLDGNQFGRAKELAKDIGSGECYLPVWEEFSELGTVTSGDTVLSADWENKVYASGDKLIVWDDDLHWEICTIYSLGEGTITINPGLVSSYSDAVIAPVRVARFAQELSATRAPEDHTEVEARFESVDTEDLSSEDDPPPSLPTYLGTEIVGITNIIIGSPSEQFTHEADRLDNRTGAVYRGNLYNDPIQTSTIGFAAHSYQEQYSLRVKMHKRKGRWKSFWVPSCNNDVTISANITSGATSIEIVDVDYAAHYPSTADFLIVTTYGVYYGIRVTGASAGDPGHEILTLASPIMADINKALISKTSRLVMSRFNSDRVEIEHGRLGSVTIAMPVVEVPA